MTVKRAGEGPPRMEWQLYDGEVCSLHAVTTGRWRDGARDRPPARVTAHARIAGLDRPYSHSKAVSVYSSAHVSLGELGPFVRVA